MKPPPRYDRAAHGEIYEVDFTLDHSQSTTRTTEPPPGGLLQRTSRVNQGRL